MDYFIIKDWKKTFSRDRLIAKTESWIETSFLNTRTFKCPLLREGKYSSRGVEKERFFKES